MKITIESDRDYRRIPRKGDHVADINGEHGDPMRGFIAEPGEVIGGGGPFGTDRRHSYSVDGYTARGGEKCRLIRRGDAYTPAMWEVQEDVGAPITERDRRFAAVSNDKSGPAWGTGETEEDALEDSREWRDADLTDDDLVVIEITPESYENIVDGNPDAWVEVES